MRTPLHLTVRMPRVSLPRLLIRRLTTVTPTVKAMPSSQSSSTSFTPLFRLPSQSQSQSTTTSTSDLPLLTGIIFDLDGTLTLPPPSWFFPGLRTASGAPAGIDILTYIDSLPTEQEREAAHERVREVERRAMREMQPQPGVGELMRWCEERGLRTGVLTRNFEEPVAHLVTHHLSTPSTPPKPPHSHTFSPILTRTFNPPKPQPHGIWECVKQWGTSVENVLMVGDSRDDVEAARRAGVGCILVAWGDWGEGEGQEERVNGEGKKKTGNWEVAKMEGVVGVVRNLLDVKRFVVEE